MLVNFILIIMMISLNNYLTQYPGFVDYSDNLNEAYFVSDIFMSYEFSLMNFLNSVESLSTGK